MKNKKDGVACGLRPMVYSADDDAERQRQKKTIKTGKDRERNQKVSVVGRAPVGVGNTEGMDRKVKIRLIAAWSVD